MDYESEIEELKKRMAAMEEEIGRLKNQQKPSEYLIYQRPVYNPKPDKPKQERKIEWEELFGKYLVGGIASVFLMIAVLVVATSVWHLLPNEIKFGGIMVVGVIITLAGSMRYRKTRSTFWSIVFGTGICVVFIDIIAGALAFSILNDLTAIVMVVVWGISTLVIQRLLHVFYTTAIVSVGALITIIYMCGDIHIEYRRFFVFYKRSQAQVLRVCCRFDTGLPKPVIGAFCV